MKLRRVPEVHQRGGPADLGGELGLEMQCEQQGERQGEDDNGAVVSATVGRDHGGATVGVSDRDNGSAELHAVAQVTSHLQGDSLVAAADAIRRVVTVERFGQRLACADVSQGDRQRRLEPLEGAGLGRQPLDLRR